MPFCAASDVAALSKNILGGSTAFSASTVPTLAEVNTWMSSGCAVIENRLKAEGYSTPVGSTTTAFGELVDCNALYAAARVEMSRTNVTLGPGERTRGQVFQEMFADCMDGLLGGDLSLVGLTRVSSGKIYAGGISISDKQTREQDTDRVVPAFRRGQFDFPGTVRGTETTAS